MTRISLGILAFVLIFFIPSFSLPKYHGVTFVSLDGWEGGTREELPFVLNNINTLPVQSKLKKTFSVYQKAGVNLIRLVIDPHWPGFTFTNEYPALGAYPNVPNLDSRIETVKQFIILAATYGIKTSITFGPPKDLGSAHVFSDKSDTLVHDKSWIGRWMTRLTNSTEAPPPAPQGTPSVKSHLALVNLADEVMIYAETGEAPWFAYYPSSAIPRNDLSAVHFFDANNGVAVGPAGFTVRTTNGGGNWTQVYSGPTTKNLNSVHFSSTTRVHAVGSAGVVRRSTNGGASWTQLVIGSEDLNSVFFFDVDNGWAVGNSGKMIVTTSNGITWSSLTSGTQNLNDIMFITIAIGWVVGDGGTIRKTTNQGPPWISQVSGTTENLNSIHFVDVNNGWAVGNAGTILRTTNGGTNWTAQVNPLLPNAPNFNSVRFTTTTNGWIAADGGVILRTIDGGNNWTAQVVATVNLNSLSVRGTTQGWVVGNIGSVGTVLTTTNGTLWNPQSGINQNPTINNSEWVNKMYTWYQTQPFNDVPFTFEFRTVGLDYNAKQPGMMYRASPSLISGTSDWILNYVPNIDAASLEYYFYLDPLPTGSANYQATAQTILDAYFNSPLYTVRKMPLWIDEYGHLLCASPNTNPQCIASETNQANYYEGILKAMHSYDGSQILGRCAWDGSADAPFYQSSTTQIGSESYGMFRGYIGDDPIPRAAWEKIRYYYPNYIGPALMPLF